MNYIKRLFKRSEGAYLRRRIAAERPDLMNLPLANQIRIYYLETIEEFVEKDRPDKLPDLVQRAIAYEDDRDRAFWKTQYFIADAQHKATTQLSDEIEAQRQQELEKLKEEHKEALALLRQTIDMLNQVKNPEGKYLLVISLDYCIFV